MPHTSNRGWGGEVREDTTGRKVTSFPITSPVCRSREGTRALRRVAKRWAVLSKNRIGFPCSCVACKQIPTHSARPSAYPRTLLRPRSFDLAPRIVPSKTCSKYPPVNHLRPFASKFAVSTTGDHLSWVSRPVLGCMDCSKACRAQLCGSMFLLCRHQLYFAGSCRFVRGWCSHGICCALRTSFVWPEEGRYLLLGSVTGG